MLNSSPTNERAPLKQHGTVVFIVPGVESSSTPAISSTSVCASRSMHRLRQNTASIASANTTKQKTKAISSATTASSEENCVKSLKISNLRLKTHKIKKIKSFNNFIIFCLTKLFFVRKIEQTRFCCCGRKFPCHHDSSLCRRHQLKPPWCSLADSSRASSNREKDKAKRSPIRYRCRSSTQIGTHWLQPTGPNGRVLDGPADQVADRLKTNFLFHYFRVKSWKVFWFFNSIDAYQRRKNLVYTSNK